jgi:hypothetical protein
MMVKLQEGNMSGNVKPCRNCGNTPDHPCDEPVVACDYGEDVDFEEWQADNARERILRVENERLRVRLRIAWAMLGEWARLAGLRPDEKEERRGCLRNIKALREKERELHA